MAAKRTPNVGSCTVDGCDNPMRKRQWCASHYSQWQRLGYVKPFSYKWAAPGMDCVVCAQPVPLGIGKRKVCSDGCQQVLARHGDAPPNPYCVRCGVEIDLLAGKKGRRIHADVKLCRRCKNQNRTDATPGELARRDGPYCQICGCDVDLLAVRPDKMRPSVDHIVPRALGGDDSKSNNQLTHLLCNQIKSDRAEFNLLVVPRSGGEQVSRECLK